MSRPMLYISLHFVRPAPHRDRVDQVLFVCHSRSIGQTWIRSSILYASLTHGRPPAPCAPAASSALHVHVCAGRALGIYVIANSAVERTTMYIGLGTLLIIIILILVLT